MEIKEQTQVFITVPYYFRMQVQKEAADIKADIISELFEKTFLERAYLLDGWIFCVQCRERFRRNAPKIHRKSRITIGKAVFVDVKSI